MRNVNGYFYSRSDCHIMTMIQLIILLTENIPTLVIHPTIPRKVLNILDQKHVFGVPALWAAVMAKFSSIVDKIVRSHVILKSLYGQIQFQPCAM